MKKIISKFIIFSITLLFVFTLFTSTNSINAQDFVPLTEIQSNTTDGDASVYKGETVTSEGIVTATSDNGFYMQSGKEPWSGIWVYASAEVAPGDKVRVTGLIDEYYNLTEFNGADKIEVIGQTEIPDPIILKTNEVSQEKYEGVLVRIEDLDVTNPAAGHGEWLVTDGSGETKIAGSNVGDSATPTSEGQKIDYIVGPVDFDYGEYKIEPMDIGGLEITFQDKGNLGKEVTYPEDLEKIDDFYKHILREEINFASNDSGVNLKFTTSKEISEIKVEYGINEKQKLKRPNFTESKTIKLNEKQSNHNINIDLKNLNFNSETIVNLRLHLDNVPYDERFKVAKTNGKYEIKPFIKEGPFVDKITENSAVISWTSNVPTEAKININSQEFKSNNKSKYHEIKVDNLKAEKEYEYVIENIERSENYSWKFNSELRTESKDDKFTFTYMSDSRGTDEKEGLNAYANTFNYNMVSDLLLDVNKRGTEFVIYGGDLVAGYANNVADFKMQLGAFKDATELIGSQIPVYELMGNHESVYTTYDDGSTYGIQFDKEGKNSTESIFAEEFVNFENGPEAEHEKAPSYKENAYYFDYDNTRFIVLNTHYWWNTNPEKYGGNLDGFIMENQMSWVKNKINKAENNSEIDHIIPIMHSPPFPNSGHIDDSMWYEGQKEYVLEMRDKLWNSFAESNKTNIVLASHEHNYQKTLITPDTPVRANMSSGDYSDSVWQIVSAGAGAPKYEQSYAPWSSYVQKFIVKNNYVQFEVDGKDLTLKAIDDSGKIIDKMTINSRKEESAKEESYKFATFNIENLTTEQVQNKGDSQAKAAAEIIQRVNPDILAINEIDNNIQQGKFISKTNVEAFIDNYLNEAQKEGLETVDYDYIYFGNSNTGIHSGFDLDNNGEIDDSPGDGTYGNDAFGYGEYPGQYAMALLSKYPIVKEEIKTFQKFRWKDMPNNKMATEFYSKPAQNIFRLSSKSHWDIPVNINGEKVHVLMAHPTPPVFDGEYNRNGKRNHDEVRLIADYISNKNYIYSDDGEKGGLSKNSKFVVMGDMNANPGEKENYEAANLLLDHDRIKNKPLPVSMGGLEAGPGARHNTQENMLLDYVLPSNNINLLGSAVMRPGVGPKAMDFIKTVKEASDHNMVWIEISF